MTWVFLLLVLLVAAITLFHLRGPDLGRFDAPLGKRFPGTPQAAQAGKQLAAAEARLKGAYRMGSER